ncbi:MAG: hypothetical protein ACM3PU_13055 [Gemmatimonadota bacterium]
MTTYDAASGIVYIPSVSVGGDTYVDVTLKNVGGLNFALQGATQQVPRMGQGIATYDGATGVLVLPTVVVGCSTYADVTLKNIGSFTFAVQTATEKLPAMSTPLAIRVQPANVNVTTGQPASFSVLAGGNPPFGYQWKRNGVDIPGATSSSYATPALSFADNGALYSVTVSNAAGSVASANATVAVTTGPLGMSISADPVSYTSVNVGDTPVLSVQANGFAPTFQWRRNGVPIAGATASSFTLPPVTGSDDGAWYSLMACNAAGCVTSLNAQIQVVSGTTSPTVQLVAANNHSLALRADGTVWGWGQSLGGTVSLARPATAVTNQGYPAQAMCATTVSFTDVIQVAGGYSHSLALRRDGTVWATGSGGYGELGSGTSQPSNAFGMVMLSLGVPLEGATLIAAGTGTSHAIRSDGSAWAWGNNGYGELGDGTKTNRAFPVQVRDASGAPLTGVTSVKAGTIHALWLKSDGTVWASGSNTHGQLGDGTGSDRTSAVQVMTAPGVALNGVTAIAAGQTHSLALLSDGTAMAWGSYAGPVVGRPTGTQLFATPVGDGTGKVLTGIVAIEAGQDSSYFVRSDGSILAVGSVAINSSTYQSVPSPIRDSAGNVFGNLRSISAQFRGALAIRTDDTVWGWGNNASMNLADGTRIDRSSPVKVQGLAP